MFRGSEKKNEMKKLFLILIISLLGCQKEKITISETASEVFFVDNAGASMRVLVKGNTSSNVYILVIHGGPGVSSYFYDTKYISQHLGDKYAMVYWDQRSAGASQGNNNANNLTLTQMVDDLKKVIEVLKYRYGNNMSLFLLGHSFGGLVAADFLTSPGNQELIKGFINVDGSHNYPLNDTLTRQMLLSYGQKQVSINKNTNKWQTIINYCNSHTGGFTLEESQKLESYASDAEKLADSVKQINLATTLLTYSIKDKYPLTAILCNLLYSEDSNFNKELAIAQFSSSLNTITIPVMLLWGKYDFTCPVTLGQDFYNRISSTEKRFVISPVSGHEMFLQDEKMFCDEVGSFVQSYR
jgi:pimeloyl-ACP methyl ester carboxylesterase